jgi:hypothetical protein
MVLDWPLAVSASRHKGAGEWIARDEAAMSDRNKVGLIVVTLVFLGMGGYFSYVEISYLLLGRETTGTVNKVTDFTRRHRGHEHTYRQVEFTFAEPNGTRRTGEDNMDTSWMPPSSGVIKVQYTPGVNGRARLAGNVKWSGFVIFAVALAVLFFAVGWLWLDARAAYKPRKKKKRVRYADD